MNTAILIKFQNHPTLKKHPYVRRHQILLKMLYALERKKRLRSEKDKELLKEEIEINEERLKELDKLL